MTIWYTYSESSLCRASHRLAVQQHLVQQHLASILHTKGHHGQTISNENHVHAGMVGNVCTREVVRRDHGYGFILPVQALEGVDGNRLARIGRGSPQW